MTLSAAGKQVGVGPVLRHHIDRILPGAIETHFGNPTGTGVVLSREEIGVRADPCGGTDRARLFQNCVRGGVDVVHRRADGHIRSIE